MSFPQNNKIKGEGDKEEMKELKVGQEVTGEVVQVNKHGYLFIRLDDDGEGIREDLFLHASEIENEEFDNIRLGMKIVCFIAKDEIQKDRIKGVNGKIIK